MFLIGLFNFTVDFSVPTEHQLWILFIRSFRVTTTTAKKKKKKKKKKENTNTNYFGSHYNLFTQYVSQRKHNTKFIIIMKQRYVLVSKLTKETHYFNDGGQNHRLSFRPYFTPESLMLRTPLVRGPENRRAIKEEHVYQPWLH